MYYGAIKKFDIANGEGIRVSLFVSGCRNRCKNCFQPDTWAFDYGKPFDSTAENIIFTALENPSVRGLSILGGEPMEPENQRELLPFIKKVKERYPDKNIWLYTGNTYEELTAECGSSAKALDITRELISCLDIMVDGRYVEEKKSLGLRFRGSSNQRIIDIKKTKEMGEIVIWDGCRFDKSYSSREGEETNAGKN